MRGQDPVFSQFYIDPVQINPGFTGNTTAAKLGLSYRMQWPLVQFAYNTYSATYDQYFNKINSGIGMNILADNAGNGIFVNSRASLYYAYKIRLAGSSSFKFGLEASLVNSRLNWDKLVFYDQLDLENGGISPGGTPYPTSEQRPDQLSRNFIDAGVGALYFNPRFYLGISIKHLTSPESNFTETNSDLYPGLPLRYSFQAGGEIPIRNYNIGGIRSFISPNILFIKQGQFSQLNVGAYTNLGVFFIGAWYRHAQSNPDAAIFSVGVRQGNLKIGYSYDLTVSKLSVRSGGAHEIGISFLIGQDRTDEIDINDCFQIFR